MISNDRLIKIALFLAVSWQVYVLTRERIRRYFITRAVNSASISVRNQVEVAAGSLHHRVDEFVDEAFGNVDEISTVVKEARGLGKNMIDEWWSDSTTAPTKSDVDEVFHNVCLSINEYVASNSDDILVSNVMMRHTQGLSGRDAKNCL